MNNKEAMRILDRLLNIFEHEDYNAIEHAIEVLKASEWQPIESIVFPDKPDFRPYNSKFLAYSKEWEVGYPTIATFLFCLNTFKYFIIDSECGDEINPTHFMLLPIPPKEGE